MHADYHRPTDDADKVNYPGEAEVVDLSFDVIDALSKMPRQQYVSKFDSETLTIDSTGPTSRSGPRASLGVVPDYGTDESTVGVRITGTTPGSPADSAGLREGDTIVQIDQKKIDNLYDLTDFLNSAKPGDHVNITVMRDKQRVQMQTTLSQRGGSN
jgi:S1-C subfamily serine protease